MWQKVLLAEIWTRPISTWKKCLTTCLGCFGWGQRFFCPVHIAIIILSVYIFCSNMTQKRMRRTAQIMLMWFHITRHFTGQQWKRKQKDKDWVTVERFRSGQGSFIHHPQSVSKPTLLFSMQGNMLCLCWWFFSFRLLSQSIKAVPFWPDTPVTGDVFHFIESFWNKNPTAVSFLCVTSRCLR